MPPTKVEETAEAVEAILRGDKWCASGKHWADKDDIASVLFFARRSDICWRCWVDSFRNYGDPSCPRSLGITTG